MPAIRLRSGLVQLTRFPVAAATVIEPGDLLYLDAGTVKPASSFPWQADADSTRMTFAAAFVGVAHGGSAAGETADVSVDVGPLSVYEAPAEAAAYDVGSPLGPAAAGGMLSRNTLTPVAQPSSAIARALEFASAGSTAVRAGFATAVHPGSANVNAAVG